MVLRKSVKRFKRITEYIEIIERETYWFIFIPVYFKDKVIRTNM